MQLNRALAHEAVQVSSEVERFLGNWDFIAAADQEGQRDVTALIDDVGDLSIRLNEDARFRWFIQFTAPPEEDLVLNGPYEVNEAISRLVLTLNINGLSIRLPFQYSFINDTILDLTTSDPSVANTLGLLLGVTLEGNTVLRLQKSVISERFWGDWNFISAADQNGLREKTVDIVNQGNLLVTMTEAEEYTWLLQSSDTMQEEVVMDGLYVVDEALRELTLISEIDGVTVELPFQYNFIDNTTLDLTTRTSSVSALLAILLDVTLEGNTVFRIQKSILAPLVTTLPLEVVDADTYVFRALVNPNDEATNVVFEYGTSAIDEMLVEAMPQSLTGTAEVLVSASVSGLTEDESYQYRVVAENEADRVAGEPMSFTTYQSSYQIAVNRSFSDYTNTTSYRLVSLPGQIDLSVRETLNGTAEDDWRVLLDNGAITNFFELFDGSDRFNFKPGRGFWMLSKTNWTVPSQQVNTVPLDRDGTYNIPLIIGWNIIGSVFNRQLLWDDILAANPSVPETALLHTFSGTFDSNTRVMDPYEAYYFLNEDVNLTSFKLPFPGLAAAASNKTEQLFSKKTTSQQLTFRISLHDTLSTSAFIVLHPDAQRGKDRLDQSAPRPTFSPLRLVFLQDNEAKGGHLALDARPPIHEGYVFNLLIESDANAPVHFTTEGLDQVQQYDVFLVDQLTGKRTNLQTHPSITLYPHARENRYKVLIGSTPFVNDTFKTLKPEGFTLSQNYPNPFSTSTTIEYSLSEAQQIKMTVYDVLGRIAQILVDNTKPAGFHQVTWDPESALPEGVYFIQLITGEGRDLVIPVIKTGS